MASFDDRLQLPILHVHFARAPKAFSKKASSRTAFVAVMLNKKLEHQLQNLPQPKSLADSEP
jgi:hypothetical protein